MTLTQNNKSHLEMYIKETLQSVWIQIVGNVCIFSTLFLFYSFNLNVVNDIMQFHIHYGK